MTGEAQAQKPKKLECYLPVGHLSVVPGSLFELSEFILSLLRRRNNIIVSNKIDNMLRLHGVSYHINLIISSAGFFSISGKVASLSG